MKPQHLYSSPNIIWVIKSRRLRWAGYVICMGKRRGHTGFWWENLREGDHLDIPGFDIRVILQWIFNKWNGGMDWINLTLDKNR
jgi:hypothetical protein